MKRPFLAKAALGLVLTNSFIALFFGVMILIDKIPAIPNQPLLRMSMAGLAFIGSALLFLLFYLLHKRNRLAFYFTLLALLGITILVFADEIGLADWIAAGLSAVPIVLLLLARKWFLRTGSLD